MLGWIVVILFFGGVVLFGVSSYLAENGSGSADVRLGWAFPAVFGALMAILAVLIAIGASVVRLF
jgi:hypothetical protein